MESDLVKSAKIQDRRLKRISIKWGCLRLSHTYRRIVDKHIKKKKFSKKLLTPKECIFIEKWGLPDLLPYSERTFEDAVRKRYPGVKGIKLQQHANSYQMDKKGRSETLLPALIEKICSLPSVSKKPVIIWQWQDEVFDFYGADKWATLKFTLNAEPREVKLRLNELLKKIKRAKSKFTIPKNPKPKILLQNCSTIVDEDGPLGIYENVEYNNQSLSQMATSRANGDQVKRAIIYSKIKKQYATAKRFVEKGDALTI